MEASTVACTAPPTQLMGKDVEADPSLADLKPEVAMAQAVVVVPPGQQAVE